ncbi:putative nuclease HARBI1 [Merluccius polli]|uniref:Nuclease HARBI1 n=1 Tax=Merluccius polli TaxID=89951 RepID=A0AA47NBH6_MERPO|nr:putative nuclease HARBI1 [Merluccius polli]
MSEKMGHSPVLDEVAPPRHRFSEPGLVAQDPLGGTTGPLDHNALRRERVFRPRLDILSFPEAFLFERYRFSSATIIYLNHILRPYITNLTHRGRALTSEQTLSITTAHRESYSRAVRKVSLALKRPLPVMVVFPGHKPVRNIKEEFNRIAGLPNVLGSVDGTQIPITVPAENEADYVNRKSFHSINVQVCDLPS